MTVEIEVNTLSTKPLGQIALANVADLFALEEKDDLSAGLRVRLKGFRERMARVIGDLPNGQPFFDLIDAVRELPPEQIPLSMREVFVAEAESSKRTESERSVIHGLCAHWETTEPEAFQMAPPKAIHRAPAAESRDERAARRRPESRRERQPGGTTRTPRTTTPADPERTTWIKQVLLERLSRAIEQGLLEAVIVAGVTHRARDRYPDITTVEILSMLRQLEGEGRVRHSANRWKLPISGRF